MIGQFIRRVTGQGGTLTLDDPTGWYSSDRPLFGGKEMQAMKLPAVNACIEIISDSIAKMPVYLMDSGTRERVTDHPALRLLTGRPTEALTAFDYHKLMESRRIAYGNAYALILRDKWGVPVELLPIAPGYMMPLLDSNAKLWYVGINPKTQEYRKFWPEDVLHYMVTKRLGAEVDYIIKGIDAKAGVAVGSRLEAMSAKRRAYYFGTDRDGNNLLYEGICAEARVVSVIRTGIFVDLFGLEVYIPLRELSYQRKGGCFSTYAYRLIWNEICTALIYANRRAAKECELIPEVLGKEDSLDEHHELSMILDRLEANASEAMAKGIRAIRLSAEGYSHAEIGSILGESDKCVAARISRTRKYLRSHPDLAAF